MKNEKTSKTTLNLRIDSQLKKQAESIFENLGISMSSGVVLYLKSVVREQGIPFDVKLDKKSTKPAAKGEKHIKIESLEDEVLDDDSLLSALNKL